MKEEILKMFEIQENTEIEFREVCGFTFVFMKETLIFGERISSADIKPIAIIYEENGEYYLAPLDAIDDIEAIVKKYVDDCL